MSDVAFERFVIEMKTIMSLKIPGGVKITNYTFQSMVQKEVLYGPKPTGGLPNLVVLDVSGNNHVDDIVSVGLQQVVMAFSLLQFDIAILILIWVVVILAK